MGGLVDVYMPDFKLSDQEHSRRCLMAQDYAEVTRRAVATMHAEVGGLNVGDD